MKNLLTVLALTLLSSCGSDDSSEGANGNRNSSDQGSKTCPAGHNLWNDKCWESFTINIVEPSLSLHSGTETVTIFKGGEAPHPDALLWSEDEENHGGGNNEILTSAFGVYSNGKIERTGMMNLSELNGKITDGTTTLEFPLSIKELKQSQLSHYYHLGNEHILTLNKDNPKFWFTIDTVDEESHVLFTTFIDYSNL